MNSTGDPFTEEVGPQLETDLRWREVWLRSFTLLGGARVDVRGEHDVVQVRLSRIIPLILPIVRETNNVQYIFQLLETTSAISNINY